MYQSVFSLTYNLLIIWPFFFGVGVMIDFMVNIGELKQISDALHYALAALLAMTFGISMILLTARMRDRQTGTA